MKINNIILVKNVRVKIIILVVIIFTLISYIIFNHKKSDFIIQVSTINTKDIEMIKSIETNTVGEEAIRELRETINLKEYVNMPRNLGEYKVIGKIEIPQIDISRYILDKTDDKALKKSATKVCGPQINKTGNFCIAGHNYQSVFGKLKYLKIGDVIKLTDTYNRNVEYKIYSIEKVSPNNIDCLSQNTNGEREVTLITCTLGAVKRIVVKAIEIYD